MTKGLALGGGATLLVLIGGIALLAMIGEAPRAAPSASRTGIAEVPPPTVTPVRATTTRATSSDDPPELERAPIKHAFIQRDDDSGIARAKGAPPPMFTRATLAQLRAAVAPAVKQCMDESFQRYPENRSLDTKPSISIQFTATAAGGTLSVANVRTVINGTQEDALLACVGAAYERLSVRTSSEQVDGVGQVQATFDYQ